MALSKIKTGSITDSAVTTAKIADGTIADADINDVAGSKLTGTVADARISTLTASKLTGALPAIDGASLTGISTGTDWQSVVTGSTLTAVAGRGYPINTTSNACTVTLPASASVGDTIEFIDYLRTWGTNSLTLEQGSLKYQGYTEAAGSSAVYSTNGQHITLTYVDATQGWIPTIDDTVSLEANPPIAATGGTITTYTSGGIDYKVHTFLTSTDFVVSTGGPMDIMMIAGGGAGGGWHSGGGGAGGMIVAASASNTIAAATYGIVIGAGGAGVTHDVGNNGSDTTGFSDTCDGGGAGGTYSSLGGVGNDGGSGCGGSGTASAPYTTPGSATQGDPSTLTGTGYGNDGGTSAGNSNHASGGGGGAGGAGVAGTSTQGGGGIGLDNDYRTGSNVTYAGGGEGGVWTGTRNATHTGLAGGGGIGSDANEAMDTWADGVANKGAGGGGRGGNAEGPSDGGGDGGSGIVVVRYEV